MSDRDLLAAMESNERLTAVLAKIKADAAEGLTYIENEDERSHGMAAQAQDTLNIIMEAGL